MRDREPIAGMIVLGALGAVLCGVTLWQGWSPVAWWIGAGVVLIALVVIAWRRGVGRRPLWVAGAAVVGLAVAAVPVLEPVLRPSAEVAWSVEGSEEPVAEAQLPDADAAPLIITADEEQVVRARETADGTVLWQHQGQWEWSRQPQVDLAGDLILIGGADPFAEPDEEMVALEAATGDVRWSAPAAMEPLVRTDSVLVVHTPHNDRGELHQGLNQGLDLNTGEVRWTAEGNRRALRGVPSSAPRAVVPVSDWLLADVPESGYQVTAVDSGEAHLVSGSSGYTSEGIVGDQLIVQEMLVHPADVDRGDTVPTQVTAYQLPAGDVAWEADLTLSYYEWEDVDYYRPQLVTFDSTLLQASTVEHTVDVLDLTDGRLSQFHLPNGRPDRPSASILWARDGLALGSASGGHRSVIDLDSAEITALAEDATPSARPAATAWLNGTASPAWQEDADGLFGREYNSLTALNLSDQAAPEPVGLGDLPDGSVEGTYAGHVVLVDSEEIPDAAADEPQSRTTAMHVLAPFD